MSIPIVSRVRQLKKCFIDMPRGSNRRELDQMVENAEDFVFTALPENDEEFTATVAAMKEAGVWRLPYPVSAFEYTATLTTREGTERGIYPLILICNEVDGLPHVAYALIKSDDPHVWVAASIDTDDFEFKGMTNSMECCIVALATKGIRRERWSGDRPVLLSRKEPSNAYTRVMVAECVEAGQGSPGSDRCKVRLHLRRGHIRRQPHGPGRAYIREIWINPMLVGYIEEGEIHHESYAVYTKEVTR